MGVAWVCDPLGFIAQGRIGLSPFQLLVGNSLTLSSHLGDSKSETIMGSCYLLIVVQLSFPVAAQPESNMLVRFTMCGRKANNKT
jgi:hypothetical protein